jgi:amino acid transporter
MRDTPTPRSDLGAPPQRGGGDHVTRSLAPGRLGVPGVVFFVLSAATPLTVAAGVVTTGMAATGQIGIPLAFVAVGLMLAVFAVGYTAMAQHLAHAGALYAYIARGIGRAVGVGAAWLALASYLCLAIGLYGAVGAAGLPLLQQWAHLSPPWWILALAAWALTAALGVARVEVNSRVLAVLLLAEVAVIVLYTVASFARPATGITSEAALAPIDPGQLLTPGVGALLVIAVLGFIGFESTVVFSEESKDRRRTVPRATFTAIAVTGVLYALASWGTIVATGPDQVVAAARELGPELFFALAADRLGGLAADIGHVLFFTSVIAALISFHALCARYAFALGRERVLPAALGRTSVRTGAPITASLVQSVISLAVIVIYAVGGLDPITQLFYVFGAAGGYGVLILLTLTAVAILRFFLVDRLGHSRWSTLVAPAAAAALLAGTLALATANLPTLLGVPADHPLVRLLPAIAVAALALGICWALILRAARPQVFAAIGRGDVAASPTPSSAAEAWS